MKRILAFAVLFVAVLALAACAAPVPMAQPTITPVPFTDLDLPEIVMPEAQEFAEFELTLEEMNAEAAGEAAYAGRSCILSPAGCACEQDLVEYMSFAFPTNAQLVRTFTGPGYANSWEMVRIGENQWSYSSLPVTFEGDDSIVAINFAFLTFTPNGYILTQGADFGSAIQTCPDVQFIRAAFDYDGLVESFYTRTLGALGAIPADTAAAIAAAEASEPLLTADFLAAIEADAASPSTPDPLFCGVAAPAGVETFLLAFDDTSARVAVSLGEGTAPFTVFLASPDNGATWRINGTDCGQ